MNNVRIFQVQFSAAKKIEETLQKLKDICAVAAEEKADIVTLPEIFCCPYQNDIFRDYAEKAGGLIWSTCASLAKQHNIYISAGSIPEEDEEGNIYNTAYVFDRNGNQIAKHRKVHLFDIDVKGGQYFKESDTFSAGDAATVFDTEFGTMGICICYDFRFPELARMMALRGAKMIIVPAAFNLTTGPLHWELVFRSQAMYNQVYTVGTAPARDMSLSYRSWGHSIVADPWGKIVNQMDEKEGYQIVDIDLAEVDRSREEIPMLKHRRPEIYI